MTEPIVTNCGAYVKGPRFDYLTEEVARKYVEDNFALKGTVKELRPTQANNLYTGRATFAIQALMDTTIHAYEWGWRLARAQGSFAPHSYIRIDCGGVDSHQIILYAPVAAAIKSVDVEGATEAWVEEGAFLFQHCSPGFHHHLEHEAAALVKSAFQDELEALTTDNLTRLKALALTPSSSTAGSRELASRLLRSNLLTVRQHMLDCVRKDLRALHVGYHHQQGQFLLQDWLVACLEKGIFVNRVTQSALYASVGGELSRILAKLKHKHAYERRWEQQARLKAEREAQARREAERKAQEEQS